jgi:hypothetical protein
MDGDTWSTGMSRHWWALSGLTTYTETSVGELATMLQMLQKQGYDRVPCHQIWAYLSNPAIPPHPVYLCIWQQQDDRQARLRELSGANHKASTGTDVLRLKLARNPQVTEFQTAGLGTGLRCVHYRRSRRGVLFTGLGYAFRCEALETDVQVFTASSDQHWLTTVAWDFDQFVRSLTVYHNPPPPQQAQS